MLAQTRLQAQTMGMKSPWSVNTRISANSFQASSFGGHQNKLADGRFAKKAVVCSPQITKATTEVSASGSNAQAVVFPPPLPKLDGA